MGGSTSRGSTISTHTPMRKEVLRGTGDKSIYKLIISYKIFNACILAAPIRNVWRHSFPNK